MIIVVSGLQAISSEVLEAAEVFGANFLATATLYHLALAPAEPPSRFDLAHDFGPASLCGRHRPFRGRCGHRFGQ